MTSLKLSAWLNSIAVALAGLCIDPNPAEADARAVINVMVNVRSAAHLQVISQARALQISAEDVRRGYVDVLQPTEVSVMSNASSGFSLEVLPMSAVVQSITVHGMGQDAVLGADGGSITHRWDRPKTQSLTLTFRLGLAPGIAPGLYSWPLHLAVQPLDTAL